MLLCIAWGLRGTHRLFQMLKVIHSSFSELKLEKSRNLCECIQGTYNILKFIDYVVARNSTSINHK